jgi:hypothetical protein
MGLFLTTIAGLVIWIVLWSIGVKAIDAFLIMLFMVLVAASGRIFGPYLPGNRGKDDEETPRSGGSWITR